MSFYRGKRAVVTGGAGFIGSNLALRLAAEGAQVTVIDSMLPGCGGNPYNLAPARDRIGVIEADISDTAEIRSAVAAADVIFNLAGEISHIHSMQFPERDLQVNTVAQLRFLLTCKAVNRGVRVVYAGTRQVYGTPEYLPVDENHPIEPVDFNGVHKYAATMYHMMLSRSGDVDAITLRLTNVYGPRMALDVSCQGFLSTFLRQAVLGETIDVFGDGMQTRDPIHVDDAVEAFLAAGACIKPPSRSYNVGSGTALPLIDIARQMSEAAGLGAPRLIPFPADRKPIDIGSYATNARRIERELGWKARVPFHDGVLRTIGYYRSELRHYLDLENPRPACRMPEHSGATWRLRYAQIG